MFPWQERIIGLRKCHFPLVFFASLYEQFQKTTMWMNYIIIREGSQLAWENVIFLNFKFYPEACTYDVILCIVKSQPGTWTVSNKQCHEWIMLSRFWSWILMLLESFFGDRTLPSVPLCLWQCFRYPSYMHS